MVPTFMKSLEAMVKIDPSYFYGSASMLRAKMYLKTPPFPLSVGDMDNALESLEIARRYQEKHYAFYYIIRAEAEHLQGDTKKALQTLSTFHTQIDVRNNAEQFTLDMAQADGAKFAKALQDGSYDKYRFDPFMQPLGSFRQMLMAK